MNERTEEMNNHEVDGLCFLFRVCFPTEAIHKGLHSALRCDQQVIYSPKELNALYVAWNLTVITKQKMYGIIGVVVFIVKEPLLLIKLYLT